MCTFIKSCKAKHSMTWEKIWEALAWSLTCLYEGFHPMTDFEGKPWAPKTYGKTHAGEALTTGGYFGVVFRLLGDLDWLANHYKLRLNPGSNNPCCFDDGDRSATPFLDLRPTARWLDTLKGPPCPSPTNHP
eukprot:13540002-Alexandrium_andersonii.AAC.1